MSEYYSGRVRSVRFNNPAQSYYVMEMLLDGASLATVRGSVHGVSVRAETWFGFEAHWETHATYGRQLVIDKAPVLRGEWDADTALRMLQGHGVGARVCDMLRSHFGDDLLTVLHDAERLKDAPAINDFTAQYIVSRWQTVRALFQSLKFLGDLELPRGRVQQIYAHFGDDAEKVLSEDPWALVQIDGVSFEQADEVASRLGLGGAEPRRLRGACLHTCKMRRGMGHLFLTSGEFVEGVRAYVPTASKEEIARTLKELHDESLLVLDNRTRPSTTAIYEPWFHRLEIETAKLLSDRDATAALDSEAQLTYMTKLAVVGPQTKQVLDGGLSLREVARSAVAEWSSHGNLSLSAAQLEGAVNALTEPVSVVTGLPGTGKTTLLKVVVKVLQDAGIPFLLVAPTGIAAKRLTSVTGAQASTIHRAFGARGGDNEEGREATYAGVVGGSTGILDGDGSSEFWGYSAAQPHPAEVVIVDESSMVDQHLLFRVLTCTSKTCRIVFVGDAAQLPSVGPGNVLRDLIDSSFFPVVALHEIFRQDEASEIVFAAHAINAGKLPKLDAASKDFVFLKVREESRVLDTTLDLVRRLYERRANFQVLSPRHAGTLGVTNLNLRIREMLNPKQSGTREMRLGSETVREGDRIMVSKNNYRFEIFNGDTGKIERLDLNAQVVTIKIHGPPTMLVQLPFKDAPAHLRLAYAVTTHKCVHPDTLIETDVGIIRAGDADVSGVVGTAEGPKEYCGKVENPPLPMLRLRTEDGYEIVVTPDHGLDVWCEVEARYVRREAREIRLQDFLRLRLGPGDFARTPPRLPGEPQIDVRARRFRFPEVLTEDVAEFFGLMVADGTLFDGGFRLAKQHVEVVDRFAHLVEIIFGASARRWFTAGAHHAEVHSVGIVEWLRNVGGMGPNAKDVPSCILSAPLSQQRRFLRGVLEDGSVHLHTKDKTLLDHVEWCSSFPDLLRKVRLLLLRLGIVCGTSGTRVPSLQIYGQQARRLGELVGFITPMKQQRCSLPAGAPTHYVVPVDREFVKHLRRRFGANLPAAAYSNGVNRRRMSRHAVEQLLTKIPPEAPEALALRGFLRDHHSPVVSIGHEVAPSVCLEVPDGHRFLQNGFHGWNSQGQEYDVILLPWVASFRHQLQRNLLYTAITRARKKVILVGHTEALERAVGNNRVDTRNSLFPDRLRLLLRAPDDVASGE